MLPGRNTLQAAIDSQTSGTTLILADGIYTGSTAAVNVMHTKGKKFTIRAIHRGMAVLDGENVRRVAWIDKRHTVLDGLNMTRGNATNVPYTPSDRQRGGGAHINSQGSCLQGYWVFPSCDGVTLIGCSIYDCTALGGAGLYLDGDATLNDSHIFNNVAGGGAGILLTGAPMTFTMTDSHVRDNHVQGQGYGGGLSSLTPETHVANIVRSHIYRNSANRGGGLLVSGWTVMMTDSSIYSNIATTRGGGGFFIDQGVFRATRCSIYLNEAAEPGGGLVASSKAACDRAVARICDDSGTCSADLVCDLLTPNQLLLTLCLTL